MLKNLFLWLRKSKKLLVCQNGCTSLLFLLITIKTVCLYFMIFAIMCFSFIYFYYLRLAMLEQDLGT